MISDNIRRFLATGLGLAIFTKDRVTEIVNEMVQQGQVSREDGERLLDEVMRRAQEQGGEIRTLMNEGVNRVLERTGLARQTDVQELMQRIEELEAKLGIQRNDTGGAAADEGEEVPGDEHSSEGDSF